MTFLNPAALWLLLGVPALIIIYLIKSQHEDRPVSSTYIWKLSTRFAKKRVPLQRLRKILAFILQLLLIVTLALTAARPAVKTGSVCDYVAILDASIGMRMRDANGISRFERAVDEIKKLATVTEDGHTVSVILADERAAFLVQKATTVEDVEAALESASCSLGACNTDAAVALAQQLCDQSPNAGVLFYTDREHTGTSNVQVVNLYANEWNVSVDGLTAESDEDDDMIFDGSLTSHGADATVAVGLRVDGKVIDAQIIECKADESTAIEFKAKDLIDYDTAEIFIEEADGLAEDNAFAVCRERERSYNVLLVSTSPLYLESALQALDDCKVTVSSSLLGLSLTGYDLYIFDGIVPDKYPADGSVLLFSTKSLPGGLTAGALSETAEVFKPDPKSPHVFSEGLRLKNTMVTSFAPLSATSDWEPVFFCNEQTVWMTKALHNGLSISVASFDLHDSNLPMQSDFLLLLRNVLKYSVPTLLGGTDYTIGDTLDVTVLRGSEKLYVDYPDDSVRPLDITADSHALTADQVGLHTVVMLTADGGDYVDFFVHIDRDETAVEPSDKLLHITLYESDEGAVKDTVSDVCFWFLLAVLVIILIEWGWYYREQY